MTAPLGNQFWKARSKHGRDKIFKTPDQLWDAACEYFQWVEDNPLVEDKVFTFQGEAFHEPVQKMRAMTIEGLCLFLHVNSEYFNKFVKNIDTESEEGQDFCRVITTIKETIRTQKFAGAAAEMLNPNIIARDLGLADKKDLSSTDGTMTPTRIERRIIDPKKDSDKPSG